MPSYEADERTSLGILDGDTRTYHGLVRDYVSDLPAGIVASIVPRSKDYMDIEATS